MPKLGERYVVEWDIFPHNPWVIRDRETGAAWRPEGAKFFAHYATAGQAYKVAERLNAKVQRSANA